MMGRATFVKGRMIWKIYWMRSDLKWHCYPLLPEVEIFEDFLLELQADPGCYFWGKA